MSTGPGIPAPASAVIADTEALLLELRRIRVSQEILTEAATNANLAEVDEDA